MKRLFVRVCEDAGLPADRLDVDVPYSRGGGSIAALKAYLEDYGDSAADCFVLGSDGNCKGFVAKRKQLEKPFKGEPFAQNLIYAVPDPHVERWYLVDETALSQAVGSTVAGHPPRHKCDKNHYKNLLKNAISSAGVIPLQGGAEYGDDVAFCVDLYKAGKQDQGFKAFCDDVKAWALRNK